MKHIYFILLMLASLTLSTCKQKNKSIKIKDIVVHAPFDMPHIKTLDFSACEKLSIVKFGAEQGNKQKTTIAIEEAITEASELGGATVVIPKGAWLTGKIHLKSNVNLHLEEGAVLIFSESPEDYLPPVYTSWEGLECYNYSPLIYAFECNNVAITGKGQLRAKMEVWSKWFNRPPSHLQGLKKLYAMATERLPADGRVMVNDTTNLRPQFIQFNRCKTVLVEGITIKNSPFWVIHPYMSTDVVIRDVKIWANGRNNDGVNPEMVQNILIEKCVFDQGGDAIALKSGRNQEAWHFNIPTKNVVVRNCQVKNAHQLLAIGSELSGGIQNVFVDSCEVSENARLNHLLYVKTNERRGGFVNNIFMSNVNCGKVDKGILGIKTDVLYQWLHLVPSYEIRLTPISNIFIENIQATNVKYISKIIAPKELCAKNITFKNVNADYVTEEEFIHENVINFERIDTETLVFE